MNVLASQRNRVRASVEFLTDLSGSGSISSHAKVLMPHGIVELAGKKGGSELVITLGPSPNTPKVVGCAKNSNQSVTHGDSDPSLGLSALNRHTVRIVEGARICSTCR